MKISCGNKGYQKGVCKEKKCKVDNKYKSGECKNKQFVEHGKRCNIVCNEGQYIADKNNNDKEIKGGTYECNKGIMKPIKNFPVCKFIRCKIPTNTDGYIIPKNISLLQKDFPIKVKCMNGYFPSEGNIQSCNSHLEDIKLRGCVKFNPKRKKIKIDKGTIRNVIELLKKEKKTKQIIEVLDSKINELNCYIRPYQCLYK